MILLALLLCCCSPPSLHAMSKWGEDGVIYGPTEVRLGTSEPGASESDLITELHKISLLKERQRYIDFITEHRKGTYYTSLEPVCKESGWKKPVAGRMDPPINDQAEFLKDGAVKMETAHTPSGLVAIHFTDASKNPGGSPDKAWVFPKVIYKWRYQKPDSDQNDSAAYEEKELVYDENDPYDPTAKKKFVVEVAGDKAFDPGVGSSVDVTTVVEKSDMQKIEVSMRYDVGWVEWNDGNPSDEVNVLETDKDGGGGEFYSYWEDYIPPIPDQAEEIVEQYTSSSNDEAHGRVTPHDGLILDVKTGGYVPKEGDKLAETLELENNNPQDVTNNKTTFSYEIGNSFQDHYRYVKDDGSVEYIVYIPPRKIKDHVVGPYVGLVSSGDPYFTEDLKKGYKEIRFKGDLKRAVDLILSEGAGINAHWGEEGAGQYKRLAYISYEFDRYVVKDIPFSEEGQDGANFKVKLEEGTALVSPTFATNAPAWQWGGYDGSGEKSLNDGPVDAGQTGDSYFQFMSTQDCCGNVVSISGRMIIEDDKRPSIVVTLKELTSHEKEVLTVPNDVPAATGGDYGPYDQAVPNSRVDDEWCRQHGCGDWNNDDDTWEPGEYIDKQGNDLLVPTKLHLKEDERIKLTIAAEDNVSIHFDSEDGTTTVKTPITYLKCTLTDPNGKVVKEMGGEIADLPVTFPAGVPVLSFTYNFPIPTEEGYVLEVTTRDNAGHERKMIAKLPVENVKIKMRRLESERRRMKNE